MEIIKWVNRGTRGLWTQVGSTLEHVVLWWSNAPLACRPSACARHLRDWLLMIQTDGFFFLKCLLNYKITLHFPNVDAPEPILSTLKGLGETLTVYVTGTTWDKQFRLTLVSSLLPINFDYQNSEFHCTNEQVNIWLIFRRQRRKCKYV